MSNEKKKHDFPHVFRDAAKQCKGKYLSVFLISIDFLYTSRLYSELLFAVYKEV